MPEILVTVAAKVATTQGAPCIVCGNSDYTVKFTLDAEWDAHSVKTARFVYVSGGRMQYKETVFEGDSVAVPVLSGVSEVFVGLYAGDLRTTTPARIPCQHSILCGTQTHDDPAPDVYLQLLALLESVQSRRVPAPGLALMSSPARVYSGAVGVMTATTEEV